MADKKSIFEINIKADKAIKAMSQIENELEELKTAQEEIEKGSYKTKKQLEASNEQYSQNAAKIKALNQEMNAYRRQMVNQVKAERENEGSLTSMRAKLSDLRKQYDELGEAERNAAKGNGLLEQISEINDALTKAEEKTGRFQRNVGNYYGAIMAAGQDLLNGKGPQRPIGPMGGGGGGGANMGANMESLRRQRRELTELQQAMSMAGLEGTKEFKDVGEAIGTCKDTMADLEAETKHYASDTRGLDEIQAGFDAADSAASSLASSLSAIGVESESVNDAEMKLSSASMAVSGAIQVQNALQRQSTLMLGIRRIQDLAAAKAEEMLAKASGKATIAQKALNLVAKAHPWVLLATAVLSVVGAFTAYSLGAKKAAEEQEKLNKKIEGYQKAAEKAAEAREMLDQTNSVREAQGWAVDPTKAANDKKGLAYEERYNAHAALEAFNRSGINDDEKKKELEDAVKEADKEYKRVELEAEQAEYEWQASNEQWKAQMKADAIEMQNELKKAQLDAMADGFEKERLLSEAEYAVEKADLINQLNTDNNITEEYRQGLQAKLKALEIRHNSEMVKINKEQAKAIQEEKRKAQDLEIANMKAGFAKERAEESANYERQVADLKAREGLTIGEQKEVNRQIEQLAVQHRKNLKKIDDEERHDLLEKEKEFADLRLETLKEGDEEYLKAKIDDLHKEMAVELDNAELTEKQKALIRKKYEKMEADETAAFETAQQELKERRQEANNSLELNQMRNRGAKESEVLQQEANQLFDSFASMEKKTDELDEEYQARVAQAYNDAIEKQNEATAKRKEEAEKNDEVKAKEVEGYQQLTDAVGNLTGALTEGTGAERAAKKVSAGLAIVSSGLALAQAVEEASKEKWPANIAAIGSVLGAMIPIISNVKTLAGYAEGGLVRGAGSGTSDSINARLSNGEFVVKANAVTPSTLPLLNAMNGQNTAGQVGNTNFLAQQMASAIAAMPNPVVSVQDINKGQSRVQVIQSSAKMF